MSYFTASLVGLVASQFLYVFVHQRWLFWTYALIVLITLVLAIAQGKKTSRLLAFLMLSLGSALFIKAGAGLETFAAGLLRMSNLIVLLTMVPIIGVFFIDRGYIETLASLSARLFKKPIGLYSATTLLSHLAGSVISTGVVIVIWNLLKDIFRDRPDVDEKGLSTAILRGFSTVILWSPSFGSVAIALSFAGIPWIDLFPHGLFLASVGLAANIIMNYFLMRRQAPATDLPGTGEESGPVAARTLEFLSALALFIAAIAFLDASTDYGVIDIVPIVSVVATALGFVLTGHGRKVLAAFEGFVRENFPGRTDEVILFTSAGFLSEAFHQSGIAATAFALIESVLGDSTLYLITVIPLLTVILGFIGFPPIVAAAVLAGAMDPAIASEVPILFALALVSGGSLAINLAPFAGPVLIESGLTNRSPLVVGAGWNWVYALILFVITQAYFRVLYYFIL